MDINNSERIKQRKNKLWEKTNGGLEILADYYPVISQLKNLKKKFSTREDDKDPSTSLFRNNDGVYSIKDWGADQASLNALDVCMQQENYTFGEALSFLCGKYNVEQLSETLNKAGFEKHPATVNEKDGDFHIELKETFTDVELNTLGPVVTEEVCKRFGCSAVESYTIVKDREVMTFTSNEYYPIFYFEDGDYKKLYQPNAVNKKHRFRYFGTKPKDYISGLKQLKAAKIAFNKKEEQKAVDPEADFKPTKLNEVIVVSGETDALNIAGLGYYPVWFNSETAPITTASMKELLKLADVVYYLPDLDSTGEKQANIKGLQHLDLRIIKLPLKIQTFSDKRGRACKDFKDYVTIYPSKSDFKKLVENAMPMCFYQGKWVKDEMKYSLNPEYTAQFLEASGFYTMNNPNSKDGLELIRIEGNIVTAVLPKDVRKYMRDFSISRQMPIAVRNLLRTTTNLSDKNIMELAERDIDFTAFDYQSQYLFFKNKTLRISKDEIKQYNQGQTDRYVWNKEVIPHQYRMLKKAPFEITYKDGEYDITINSTESKVLCFLINSSRMYWRKELEDRLDNKSDEERAAYRLEHKFDIAGPLLTEDEKRVQKLHLINKIFSLGYMLHRYKSPVKPWAIWAMDNKIVAEDESHGRSGKSFFCKLVEFFMQTDYIGGRNPKVTENPHIYERVTKHTGAIIIDDANKNLKFDFFFDCITGKMVINKKNQVSYSLSESETPKIIFSSNFGLKQVDPSTSARLLYDVFSDYYHEKGQDDEYRETRKISDDFEGRNLFSADYKDSEWNQDYNVFVKAIQFHLSVPGNAKINPPMDNVMIRQLNTVMGDAFRMWAETYFSEESGNFNKLLEKKLLLDEFKSESDITKWTTAYFTKALKAFCKVKGYTFNPTEMTNKDGRILRKSETTKKTTDMVYIQKGADVKEAVGNVPVAKAPKKAGEDDLPF